MSDNSHNIDSIFLAASEIDSAIERAAFLSKSCGDDLELRKQVECLSPVY